MIFPLPSIVCASLLALPLVLGWQTVPSAAPGRPLRSDTIRRPLSEMESKSYGIEPICTITWFRGDHQARKEAVDRMRQRTRDVIRSNPWVGGSVVRGNQGVCSLEYRQDPCVDDVLDRVFADYSGPPEDVPLPLHHEMTMADLRDPILDAGYVLRPKSESQSVWRVALVRSSGDPSVFGIVCSLSHEVGDGHTFYALYDMVVGAAGIRSLNNRRVSDAEARLAPHFSENERNILSLPGSTITCLRRMLGFQISRLFGGRTRKRYTRCFLIDDEKIASLKKEETRRQKRSSEEDSIVNDTKPDVPSAGFVSTNDIVTSWFFNRSAMRHCVMIFNLRGRIPTFGEDLAGNYIFQMYLRYPYDVAKPSMIRNTVTTMKRTNTGDKDLGRYELMSGGISQVTNWASLTGKTVELGPRVRQLVHFPVQDFEGSLFDSNCIVFRAAPGKTGVVVTGDRETHERLGRPVFESSEEFPLIGSDLTQGKSWRANTGSVRERTSRGKKVTHEGSMVLAKGQLQL